MFLFCSKKLTRSTGTCFESETTQSSSQATEKKQIDCAKTKAGFLTNTILTCFVHPTFGRKWRVPPFPNRIAELRKARKWPRRELASRIGTTPQQIERLEKGMRRLTDVWISRIAAALDTDPASILGAFRPNQEWLLEALLECPIDLVSAPTHEEWARQLAAYLDERIKRQAAP